MFCTLFYNIQLYMLLYESLDQYNNIWLSLSTLFRGVLNSYHQKQNLSLSIMKLLKYMILIQQNNGEKTQGCQWSCSSNHLFTFPVCILVFVNSLYICSYIFLSAKTRYRAEINHSTTRSESIHFLQVYLVQCSYILNIVQLQEIFKMYKSEICNL